MDVRGLWALDALDAAFGGGGGAGREGACTISTGRRAGDGDDDDVEVEARRLGNSDSWYERIVERLGRDGDWACLCWWRSRCAGETVR